MASLCSLIPRNVIACVEGLNFPDGRYYALWKDGSMLVIQATPVTDYDGCCMPDQALLNRLDREFDDGLSIIQTLLDEIQFGTNWGYLFHRKDGYCIRYTHTPIDHISCRIFARLVDENLITVTKWLNGGKRHGIWNGRDVDLIVAWNSRFAKSVERETNGHYLTRGLDLTFEVLGHVTRSVSGEIIGLMTEPADGRYITFDDKVVVYDAVAKLAKHGLYMDHLIASDIMISNGSVRFLSVSWLRRCEYGSPSAKEAHSRQWQQLERLFDGFIRDTKMYACVATRLLAQQARIIPRLPRPQRPLTPPPIFPRTPSDLMVYLVLYTPECFDDWLRTSGNTLPSKSHRNKGSKYWRRSNIGCLISPSSPPPDKFHGSCEEVVDKPLIDRHLLSSRIPHSRAEARTASYPYGNGVQKKLLLRCDDTD